MVDRIYRAVLAGASAAEVQPQIDGLPEDTRELLLCMLSGIRNELASTCIDRACEVDRILDLNNVLPPQTETTIADLCQYCAISSTCTRIRRCTVHC